MSSWPAMNAFLRSPWSAQEEAERVSSLNSIQKLLSDLEERVQSSGQELNYPALDLARSFASNTLIYRQEEKTAWHQALSMAAMALHDERELSFEMMLEWNRTLRQDFEGPSLRTNEQSLTGRALLPFAEIPNALADCEEYVFRGRFTDSLSYAAAVYQWVISIHPFPNGNGRTSRLAVDYILLQNGYLPVVFPTPLSSAVALFPDRPRQIRPIESFRQIVRGIERAVEILTLPRELK